MQRRLGVNAKDAGADAQLAQQGSLMTNDQTLGFVNQWLHCEAISPFFRSYDTTQTAVQTCPADLRPTSLQLTVDHHPWVDLLPDPRMRNNILQLGDEYDDGPLCHDIADNRHGSDSEGLIVWGDPCNPESWEIGEDFYKKWPWVLQGSLTTQHVLLLL